MINVAFMLWMLEVDRVLQYVYGITTASLPADLDYQVWFNTGLSPAEAVEAVQELIDSM
jgi:hypothetical protein